ncbi:hypothetical protein BEN47_12950 [Hymenobacter lapidarius]|uniref:Glycosyltransferase RgtA/B/C/D-like domain-containing protein n=1 Tax=Hymenobacter lapidarius TaxID=1908237 RepID=A0A1G1T6P4_9BACT|nr:hypothetical protein BEN47_12950 [Hymenobacter lapidarius]
MLVLGYWQRWTCNGKNSGIWGLAGLIILLYAANPLTYLVSGLLLGLLAIFQSPTKAGFAAFLRRTGWLLLAYLPTLPLLGWYFWQKGTATSAPAQHYGENFADWLHLEPLAYFGSAEGTYRWLVAGLILLALAGASWQLLRRQVQLKAVLPWATGTLLLLLAYIILPDAISGGSIIRPRWGLLSYLTILVALGALPWMPRLRLFLLGAGTIIAIIFLGFRFQKFASLQNGLAEYRSVSPYLTPGTTLLPLTYAQVTRMPNGQDVKTYISIFSHAASYLCIEKDVFNYDNYEANTEYFPLTWRPGCAPLLEAEQLPARLAPFLYQPHHAPTYLLLWGRQAAPAASTTNARQIANYINHFGYVLRFRSASGLLELYQRPF